MSPLFSVAERLADAYRKSGNSGQGLRVLRAYQQRLEIDPQKFREIEQRLKDEAEEMLAAARVDWLRQHLGEL